VPDSLRHGLRISLRSPPGHPHVTLVPLPSSTCSSVDRNRNHSERAKKWRHGTFLPRTNARHGDLNDNWNPQRYTRKSPSFKSLPPCVRRDSCSTSSPTDSRQLLNAKSCPSQRSPPIKLTLLNSCNKVQNGTLKMGRNKAVTGDGSDGGDEYIVVENRNYTKDSLTKITFQRHKRRDVSVEECKKVEMKVKGFASDQDVPAVLNEKICADTVTVHDVSSTHSEGSDNTSNLTVSLQGTVKRRLSIELDQESSKSELCHSHKKRMSNISHASASSRQEIATLLEDTGDIVSEVCSLNKAALLNDKSFSVSQPEIVQSARASSNSCHPKFSSIKKRHYFEDMYLEKDVLPLFQPDRILSVSSTKKKRTNLKEKIPQVDGKMLEQEIKSLSSESHVDYSEMVSKKLTEDTDVKAKEGQDCSTEGSSGILPNAEEHPAETVCKDTGLLLVSSSEEQEPELHKLSDCRTEDVGSSSVLKASEQQKLWNESECNVVESTKQGYDVCQACGHVYSSHDERTVHIRRHPYHCQRCHLAFKSEVSVLWFTGYFGETSSKSAVVC